MVQLPLCQILQTKLTYKKTSENWIFSKFFLSSLISNQQLCKWTYTLYKDNNMNACLKPTFSLLMLHMGKYILHSVSWCYIRANTHFKREHNDINSSHATAHFLCLWFSDVLRRYNKTPLPWNVMIN